MALAIEVPGAGELRLEHLVLDYNGTLAVDGGLIAGVADRLHRLARTLQVHVVTADTFGRARSGLAGLPCTLSVLPPGEQDARKLEYVRALGAERVVAIGNGRNDRAMIGAAALGIAVDVCHATDTPGNDKKQLGDTKLGAGPALFRGPNINPHVFDKLRDAAKNHEIPVQLRGTPRATGTDANAIQITRDGVATGLVGLPNRYMHSPVEVVCLEDLERAARLLAEFCAGVTPQMDWTP